ADITYSGVCGEAPSRPCWRTHLSTVSSFTDGADWGEPMVGYDIAPVAADMDGDGRDDIVWAGECDAGNCWFMQFSTDSGFSRPMRVGEARRWKQQKRRTLDFDGDSRANMFSAAPLEEG